MMSFFSCHRRALISTSVVVAAGLTLSACSNTSDNKTDSSAKANQAVSVENCGVKVSLSEPAHRLVSVEQGTTETLLAFDAQKDIVGVGHTKDHYWKRYEDRAKNLPVISDSIPNAEAIRGVDPDLVLSPFESVWTESGTGTREEYSKLGVGTFTTNVECAKPDEDPYTVLERDYEQLGTLLGKEARGKELIEEQRAAVKAAKEANSNSHKSVGYLYSIFDNAPYVAGNYGIPSAISTATGSINVFAGLDEAWPQISWEAFADADPDVIVLVDLPGRGSPGDLATEKIEALKSNPATRNMKAVQGDKFIVVPGAGLSPGARSIEPLEIVSKKLAEMK